MSDRLERGVRALRDSADGRAPQAEETLARVLRDLRRAPVRRPAPTWSRAWLLAAALLAISTAAAARSGGLERVFRALVGESSDSTPLAHTAPRPAPAVPSAVVAPAPTSAEEAPAIEPTTLAPAPAPAPAPATVRTPRPTAVATAPAPAPAASAPSIPSAPSDDQAFANAHALHFHGSDPARALAAWDDYLHDFPAGRFAPEARYNRAIDLLKLGRAAEAKDALQPFASGAYGPYRQDEARAILRSIGPAPTP